MPIRTNRGRSAVYRRLWGWPLRSPAHLIGVGVVVLALIIGLGFLVPQLLGAGERGPTEEYPRTYSGEQPGDQGGSAADTSGSALPTRLTEPLRTPTHAPPAPQALQAAKSWAQAWVKHPRGVTNKQWLDGLRPFTTQEYLPTMSSVDPANIPASRVTGEPKAVNSYTSSVEVDVPTDALVLRITVVKTGDGWRVADYSQGQ